MDLENGYSSMFLDICTSICPISCAMWTNRGNDLHYRIQAGHLVTQITHDLKRFKRIMLRDCYEGVFDCFLRRLFCRAIDHNRTDLVAHLLADDEFCDLNSTIRCCDLPRPLIYALRKRNSTLVEQFLLAGALVTFKNDDDSEISLQRPLFWHEKQSAIQYACLLSEPDLLELLVIHDRKMNRPRFIRTIVTTQTTTCVFLTKGGRATPLHNVIDLALACFHRTLVWDLPDIVQLVIDSGGYVHDRHTNGLTALQCLMDMVINMFSEDNAVALSGSRLIVETTRVLLEAGLKSRSHDVCLIHCKKHDRCDVKSTRILLDSIISKDSCKLLKNVSYSHVFFCAVRDQFRLVAELVKLLLMYPHQINCVQDFTRMMFRAAVKHVKIWEKIIRDFPHASVAPYNDTMSIMSDIFRYIMLADDDTVDDELCEMFTQESFTNHFIYFAGYSCQSGRSKSKKLVCALLRTVSLSNINILRRSLSDRQCTMTEATPDKLRTFVNDSVAWVQRVELQRSLQHLASRAIRNVMSFKSLLDTSTEHEIPRHLKSCISLEDD